MAGWEVARLLPAELEARQRQIQYRRRHILRRKIEPYVRGALASGHFQIHGTSSAGDSRDIEARVLRSAAVDIEQSIVAAQGGGPSWYGVTAELIGELGRPETILVGSPPGPSRAAAPSPPKRHNGLDYNHQDATLIVEMHALIETRAARSAEDAARAVVRRAAGHGGDASKVKRLSKRYRIAYSRPPVQGFE